MQLGLKSGNTEAATIRLAGGRCPRRSRKSFITLK